MSSESITTAKMAPEFSSESKDCAVLYKNSILAAGPSLGANTKITSRINLNNAVDTAPWMGVTLAFPFGPKQTSNEDSGFGVHYHFHPGKKSAEQLDELRLNIKLPVGQFEATFEKIDSSGIALFPKSAQANGNWTSIRVSLKENARVAVDGFGIPFLSDDDELTGWVNDYKPIVDGFTLLDFFASEDFHIIVPRPVDAFKESWQPEKLRPPLSYPYGDKHDWDLDHYRKLLSENKRKVQFEPTGSFEDDNSHLAVMTQIVVQDVLWLDDAVNSILKKRLPVYFVPQGSSDRSCFVVMKGAAQVRDDHLAAWRRLTKDESFRLHLFYAKDEEKLSGDWDAKIMDYPDGIDELKSHPVGETEMVLRVRRPDASEKMRGFGFKIKIFSDRTAANREEAQAIANFHPNAEPTNLSAWVDVSGLSKDDIDDRVLHLKATRLELHRALWRGKGFYDWMTKSIAPSNDKSLSSALTGVTLRNTPVRPLPVENFLDIETSLANAIVEEALPGDRDRFRRYLSSRPLGLGIITAGPGFGKTTALAAATLALGAKYGPILCSGPTHASVNNFAKRLDKITHSVVIRCNQGKGLDDRTCYSLVIRGYKDRDEMDAFLHLIKDPKAGDKASPHRGWKAGSKWKLHLSVAYWALVLFRSKAVEGLQSDDKPALFELQAKIDADPSMARLRDIATGAISFAEYSNKPVDRSSIGRYFSAIIAIADFFCTTPAMTSNVSAFRKWKNTVARGVAFDEAANMHRADMFEVWGNSLLPCIIGGDARQLMPTVITGNEQDSDGNFRHTLVRTGRFSAMEFLQAHGMPVYRLRVQLRMAEGQFDMMSRLIYEELPFTYAESCKVTSPAFKIGHDVESFVQKRYPELSPPPAGKLLPVFIHAPGPVHTDPLTGSKRAPSQVKAALSFIEDLVKEKGINLADIGVLTAYSANLVLIKKDIKKTFLSLVSMPEASTVDAYQGDEKPIIVAIMGTAHPRPGPGVTTDQRRLNVMLSRQQCGLVIIGDFNVGGPYNDDGTSKKGKGKAANKAKDTKFKVETVTGEEAYVDGKKLQGVHRELILAKRVAGLVAK